MLNDEIAVEDHPELAELVARIEAGGTCRLTKGGKPVAEVRAPRRSRRQPMSEEERERLFLSARGGWKDLDTDKMVADIYAWRDLDLELELERRQAIWSASRP